MKSRVHAALIMAGRHLAVSIVVAALLGLYVFWILYPPPFWSLLGGGNMLRILITTDVICGALLTLIVYDPKKIAWKWWLDIFVIVVLQLLALGYGMWSVLSARPVRLAFEKDLFRVVRFEDVWDWRDSRYKHFFSGVADGPSFVTAKVKKSTDSGYLDDVMLSLGGVPPAFRSYAWADYSISKAEIQSVAIPISGELVRAGSSYGKQVLRCQKELDCGIVPLSVLDREGWWVVVRMSDAQPLGFVELNR